MSYYILPKNINIINVNPISSNEICQPYISHSFVQYYLQTKNHIISMFNLHTDLSDNTFEDAIKIINPYEFIFSKVPGSNFSVSKLKPKTNLFYDLFEIFYNLSFFDKFKETTIKSLHISSNYSDSIDCYELFREGCSDEIEFQTDLEFNNNLSDLNNSSIKYDHIFVDYTYTNDHDFFVSLIKTIIFIFKNQNCYGNIIIKVKDTIHKPVIEFLYLLTSLYDKVYITKPSTNNVTTHEKYIVCKSFLYDKFSNTYFKLNFLKLIVFIKKLDNKNIINILENNVPYFFKNKIDDLNIIIGQQQIDALDLIINVFKNKNKHDKIETIKKSNIQKSVFWCEKYKIPCNKFSEKINIFLPIM
jgi:hypothetical protein